VFYGSDSAAGEFNFDTSSSIDDSSVINAKHQDKAGPAKSRKRKGTKMEKVHVLSSVEPLPLPKQTLQPGSIPKFYYSPDYDDYYSAPLFKKSPSVLPGIWTFDNTGTSIIPEIWSSWKDRGYQLHPLFFLSITSNKPTDHEDHLLPFPISTSSYDGPSHGSINAFVQNNDSCVSIPIAAWMTIVLRSPKSPKEFCNPFLVRFTRVIADVRPGSGPFLKALQIGWIIICICLAVFLIKPQVTYQYDYWKSS